MKDRRTWNRRRGKKQRCGEKLKLLLGIKMKRCEFMGKRPHSCGHSGPFLQQPIVRRKGNGYSTQQGKVKHRNHCSVFNQVFSLQTTMPKCLLFLCKAWHKNMAKAMRPGA